MARSENPVVKPVALPRALIGDRFLAVTNNEEAVGIDAGSRAFRRHVHGTFTP
jgi:hypothetical protein